MRSPARILLMWRVDFDDRYGTNFYINPNTGALATRRRDYWRTFDFFWMLHIMDYEECAGIHKPLLLTGTLFSLANGPGEAGSPLVLNMRTQPPPQGNESARGGTGSSYMFNLGEGDRLNLAGPYGNFHVKESRREMVFIDTVAANDVDDLNAVKSRHHMEPRIRSCHTGLPAEDYVFIGHIRARLIRQFLQNPPRGARGLAVWQLNADGSRGIYTETTSAAAQF